MENDKATPEKERQIESELCRIENHLTCLAESINELNGRLLTVSMDEPPRDKSDADEPALVPMAERLKKYNCCIEDSNNRIVDIIRRVEI